MFVFGAPGEEMFIVLRGKIRLHKNGAFITNLTPGTSIVLGSGATGESEITYNAPAGAGVGYQLASSDFRTADAVSGTLKTVLDLTGEDAAAHEAGQIERRIFPDGNHALLGQDGMGGIAGDLEEMMEGLAIFAEA